MHNVDLFHTKMPQPKPPPGYQLQAEDTSYEVELILLEGLRRMSTAEKIHRMQEDCHAVEELALVGLRRRYPSAGEHELRLRLGALRLGRDIMVRVFGWDPEKEGY